MPSDTMERVRHYGEGTMKSEGTMEFHTPTHACGHLQMAARELDYKTTWNSNFQQVSTSHNKNGYLELQIFRIEFQGLFLLISTLDVPPPPPPPPQH